MRRIVAKAVSHLIAQPILLIDTDDDRCVPTSRDR